VPSRNTSTPPRSGSRVAWAKIGDDTFDGDGGIDGAELALGGDRLWQDVAGVGLIKERLTLQIGGLHEVAINDPDVADAGSNKKIGGGSSDGAATDDGRA